MSEDMRSGVNARGLRYAAQRLGLLLLFAVALFGSAGTLDWPRGWWYLVAVLVLEVINLCVLALRAPETLNQRGTFAAGVKPFDKAFAVLWLALAFVTPVVAGLLNNRVGNLTSAVALRLTFMGMLNKNERKQYTYSEGIRQICRMVLSILDTANIYHTDAEEREVDIIFPSPLPENMLEKLKEAQIKRELGVPAEQVLRELGYETTEQG